MKHIIIATAFAIALATPAVAGPFKDGHGGSNQASPYQGVFNNEHDKRLDGHFRKGAVWARAIAGWKIHKLNWLKRNCSECDRHKLQGMIKAKRHWKVGVITEIQKEAKEERKNAE